VLQFYACQNAALFLYYGATEVKVVTVAFRGEGKRYDGRGWGRQRNKRWRPAREKEVAEARIAAAGKEAAGATVLCLRGQNIRGGARKALVRRLVRRS